MIHHNILMVNGILHNLTIKDIFLLTKKSLIVYQ
jgi:hypothetical protein